MATRIAPKPPKIAPKPGKVVVVRAMYNYTAQHSDELSFQEGDILYVFDKISDADWWKARCGDKTGVIPSNYVENSTEEISYPLHDAARRNNLNYLRECLQQGVSASGLDRAGNTPLFWACHAGHLDCAQELIALPNPPLDAQNRIGDTALHAAASHGHLELVHLLMSHGADPTLTNTEGLTAEQLATPAVRAVLQANSSRASLASATYDPQDYDDENASD